MPTADDEALCDLALAREDAVGVRTQGKHRSSAIVWRGGVTFAFVPRLEPESRILPRYSLRSMAHLSALQLALRF